MAAGKFRIALLQLSVSPNKASNLEKAYTKIKEAVSEGAQLVCLSECFAFPYGVQYFDKYAETIPGETSKTLSKAAKDNGVYVVGGSMSETEGGKLYNTCLVYGPDGNLLAKHRKVHLFDIDIPGKITFKESEKFTPGSGLTMFNTKFCKIGLGICYDLRFAPMAQIYAQKGCKLVIYPGAFNMTTGPLHWELLQRGRAADNQIYIASISPARDEKAGYVAFGHSMLVDPWGKVVKSADEKENAVIADVDLSEIDAVRQQIPITKQARADLYKVESLKTAHGESDGC